jgi:hypothetical protein
VNARRYVRASEQAMTAEMEKEKCGPPDWDVRGKWSETMASVWCRACKAVHFVPCKWKPKQ